MKIGVLGGYGGMAQVIVRDLIESPETKEVVICGRNFEKARSFAHELNSSKALPVQVDITDPLALARAIKDFDVVINSSWYEHNLAVMKVAISTGVDYVDLGGLYHMTLEQLKLDQDAKQAGVTCLLGMGSTPGTMNVMAAHAATRMERIDKVKLRSGYAVVSERPKGLQIPYSFRTVLDEFTKQAPVLREGKSVMLDPLTEKERFVLPAPVGEVEGYFTIHSELATLPKNIGKGIREMDFIVAYEPEFTQTLAVISKLGLARKNEVAVGNVQVAPFEVISTLVDAVPKEIVLDVDVQHVDVEGWNGNDKVSVRCDAVTFPHDRWNIGGGTVDTGVPASVTAQWIASGKLTAKGVVSPEVCIDPLPYFKELNARDRGIKVYETIETKRLLS